MNDPSANAVAYMNEAAEDIHTQHLQRLVRSLLTGVAPEREAELQRYWDDYGAQFHILEDGAPGSIVMEAAAFGLIRFNHRTLRLMWLASFAAWEGYSAFHHWSVSGETDTARFQEIIDCFETIRSAANVDDVPMPPGIPEPGELVDHMPGNPARVAGELAIFAVGWAFLHEIQHLTHVREGTSAAGDNAEECRQEELSCDTFATRFILQSIEAYARESEQSFSMVSAKRQLGIHCALFAMALMLRDSWGEGRQHPALQVRIDAVLDTMNECGMSKGAAILAISAFTSLKLVYPEAPSPLDRVNEVAIRENWTPFDELF